MHPKNTTAPPGAQASPTIPAFSPEQAALVAALLAAERSHACRWWTYLNEARIHKQMPDWIEKQVVGCHPDYDRWSADCLSTNRALLGIDGHLNAFDESQLIDCSVGTFVGREPDLAPQKEQVPFRGAHVEEGQ